jgi:RimJ/RimL family protein N-acetyltransferase
VGGDPIEAAVITTEHLVLVPLGAEDADELADILFDGRLHDFIGSPPESRLEVHDRLVLLAAGSPRADEDWLNWVVRRRFDSVAVGTVQATVREVDGTKEARLGWMIGVEWQNHGFASEAATALVGWMAMQNVEEIAANIHPEHNASAAVASRAGLRQTEEIHDGERVWRAPRTSGGAHAEQR